MARYQIENRESGIILGVYEGIDAADVLDVLAHDASYDSYETVRRVSGDTNPLMITEVPPKD